MAINPLKLDPTRTAMLRRKFMTDMAQRFRKLRDAIFELIVDEDALALTKQPTFTLNARWQFKTDDAKLQAFQEWFAKQVEEKLLSVDWAGDPWTAQYVHSAYRKGVVRAWLDASPKDLTKPASFVSGSKQQFLTSAFSRPEAVSKLKLLATRSFEELKGMTQKMAAATNRVLANAVARGENPVTAARALAKELDISKKQAMRIARTEIIHAHAEGQLDGMEALGVEEVSAMVEWITAGDSRVCPQCSALQGVVLKLKDARGLIPRHPNCRCAWSPANVGESPKGQKRSAAKVRAAVLRSVKAETPNAKNPARASTWAGGVLAK